MKKRLLVAFFILLSFSIGYSATLATIVSATATSGTASMSCDKNTATRWESTQGVDPQWIYWDLGTSQSLSQIIIDWEAAAASNYTIQGSADAANWTTLATVLNSKYMVDHVMITNNISGNFRYVRMYGTTRTTIYGYSIWEVSIFVNSAVSSSSTAPVSSSAASSTGGLATIVSATASAIVGAQTAALSCDNNTGSRWESPASDPQWIYWDLGSSKQLNSIIIDWEVASAKTYQIQGSADAAAWTTLATVNNALSTDHNKITTAISGNYRYVRMYGTARTTIYGYSIWEVSIYTGTGPVSSVSSSMPVSSSGASSSLTGVVLASITAGTASTIVGANTAALSYDNNTGTRWESASADPQWIYWDLGSSKQLNAIIIDWEVASAKTYTIQGSTDAATWTVLATVNNASTADHNKITTAINGNFRYVKMNGTARTTVWGYSIWEVQIYVSSGPVTPVNLTLQTPYLQYLEVNLSPADNYGNSLLKFQNVQSNYGLTYNDGTAVTYAFGGMSLSGQTPVFRTTTKLGAAVTGTPGGAITVAAYAGQVVQIYLTNLATSSASSIAPISSSSVSSAASSVSSGAFAVISPVNGAMITTTRRPTLTWNAYAGATSYDVYVNITRSDYDWKASGNLLDRYTKVGTSTTTSFTLTSDLVDRWTYQWYVVGNGKNSTVGQFSVYIPYVANTNDGVTVINGCRDLNKNGVIDPYEDWHNPIATRLNDLMSKMTADEKFRQSFYGAESDNAMNGFSFSYGVTGGMTDTEFACAKTRLGIPTAFAGDKIHGWKTIYPTQLGIAATRDPQNAYICGNLQRVEQKSWGFTGMLMPLAEVDTKVLYPRFQEGCGENADEAAAIVRAIVCGLQGGPELNPHSLMTTVKHWPSQGAGGEGPTQYDAVTIKYHMKTWYAAVEANCCSVMPGYSSSPYLDPTGKGANSSKPIIDYLRNVIGFKGFIVTDWLGATSAQTIESMGVGIDVMGGAPASGSDLNTVVAGIGQARIDDACRRILEMKFRLGMFENPYGDPTCTYTAVDATNNHNTVLAVAKKSITLLKNNGVLPFKLTSGQNIIVAGPRATWINSDNNPNTIWQSIYYSDPMCSNYFQAMGNKSLSKGVNVYLNDNGSAQVAVVVIGEVGYTHATEWSNKEPTIPADQVAVIQGFKNRGIPVVTVIISPRPYVLGTVNDISDAIMLVYRGGTAIADAVASLCWGEYTPTGKLPFQMPRSDAQIGTDDVNNQIEHWELPYDIGATDAQRATIRAAIDAGTAPVPTGDPLYQYGAGLQNF